MNKREAVERARELATTSILGKTQEEIWRIHRELGRLFSEYDITWKEIRK